MNVNEAKNILLLYRAGTADAEDPEIAEALALAKIDPELGRWLAGHCSRQQAIGEKFRQITIPAGLKEQIISEQAAAERAKFWRPKYVAAAMTALLLLCGMLAFFWLPKRGQDDTLSIYKNQMVGIALRGYGMDLITNDPDQIRSHLRHNQAPADYVLPAGLQKVTVTGCAVATWQNQKVAMICFRTGKALPPGEQSDLWVFIADRTSLAASTVSETPQFSHVNRLITATWQKGDRVYLLGTAGDAQTIRQYL